MLAEAPVDDEITTEEELRELAEARKNIASGQGIPFDEFKKELGLWDSD